MKKIVLCAPNISEGQDKFKIRQIVFAATEADVKLLGVKSDKDHNRTVITFAGEPDDVALASYSLIYASLKLIDMRHHKGEHPRLGAVDVCPFVPIFNMTMRECVELAQRLARAAGCLGVPVYLYGEAAMSPTRKKLADIRRGQYEGLAEKLKDTDWKPDFGPAVFNPKSGAIVVGARDIMLAFNVNLKSDNLDLARVIAKRIRGSSNGIFPSVQAMGIDTRKNGYVQVSMNLHNYKIDSIGEVFRAVKKLAAKYKVKIHSSEIIGLVPREALKDVPFEYLRLKGFDPKKQIIEEALGL